MYHVFLATARKPLPEWFMLSHTTPHISALFSIRSHSQSSGILTRVQRCLAVAPFVGASLSWLNGAPTTIRFAHILPRHLPGPTLLHARVSCVEDCLPFSRTSSLPGCHVHHRYTVVNMAEKSAASSIWILAKQSDRVGFYCTSKRSLKPG